MTPCLSLRSIETLAAFCAILFLGLAPRVHGADLIPRDAFFSPATTTVLLSPDGRRIAHGESKVGLTTLRTARWVSGPREGETETIKLRGAIMNATWAHTNEDLIVTKRARGGAEIVSYAIASGEEVSLSKSLGPKVRLVALRPGRPKEVVIRVFAEGADDTLWIVQIDSGEGRRLLSLRRGERVHLDGEFRPVVMERDVGLCEIALLKSDGSDAWTEFRRLACDLTNLDGPSEDGVRGVIGVDAAATTLFVVDHRGRDRSALLSIDLKTLDETVLAEDADADVSVDVLRDATSGRPVMAYAHFGIRRHHFFDPEVERVFAMIEGMLGFPFKVVARSTNDTAWIVVPLDGGPDRFHLYDRSTNDLVALFPKYAGMTGYSLGKRTSHIVETKDGFSLPCHVYLPPGCDEDDDGLPDVPLPTVLYVHGGPSTTVPWDDWHGQTVRCQQLLADRGYAAIRVEFRGAGGFGNRFREAGHRRWATDALDDVIAIADWAVEAGIADPERLGIWGFSHGGYATLAALAFHPEKFACGFAWSPPSALDVWIENEDFEPYLEILSERYGDPRTAEGRDLLRRQSPLYSAERIEAPLLLVQGANDEPVPPRLHAEPLVAALNARGHPVTFALFTNEGHGFSRSTSWVSVWSMAEQFFAQHLGGRAAPFGDDLTKGVALEIRSGSQFIPALEAALK